jgi:hypothetical protein
MQQEPFRGHLGINVKLQDQRPHFEQEHKQKAIRILKSPHKDGIIQAKLSLA